MSNTTFSYPLRQGTADGVNDQTNTVGARVLTVSTAQLSTSFQSPPNCRLLRATAFVRNAVTTVQSLQIGTTASNALYGSVSVTAVGTYAITLGTAIGDIQDTTHIRVGLSGTDTPTTGVVDVVIEVISSSAV